MFLVAGIAFMVLGVLSLRFRDDLWDLQAWHNRAKGQVSERTPEYDTTQRALGIGSIALGIGLVLLGALSFVLGGGPHAAVTSPLDGRATRPIRVSATDTRRATPPSPSPPVGAATRGTAAYPVGCTPAEVEAFLARFLDAFNRGDSAALHAFFPAAAAGQAGGDYSGEKFVWYSMTDEHPDFSKRHFVTFDLPTLWAYFAERHAHQERLRLARVQVSRQDATVANLEVDFYRTADDVPPDAGRPPGQATGKAVINCRDRTILVMSLGMGGGRGTPTPSKP